MVSENPLLPRNPYKCIHEMHEQNVIQITNVLLFISLFKKKNIRKERAFGIKPMWQVDLHVAIIVPYLYVVAWWVCIFIMRSIA